METEREEALVGSKRVCYELSCKGRERKFSFSFLFVCWSWGFSLCLLRISLFWGIRMRDLR